MIEDTITHFACECGCDHTLCDRPIAGYMLSGTKATCEACVESHREEGWIFPLPALVVAP